MSCWRTADVTREISCHWVKSQCRRCLLERRWFDDRQIHWSLCIGDHHRWHKSNSRLSRSRYSFVGTCTNEASTICFVQTRRQKIAAGNCREWRYLARRGIGWSLVAAKVVFGLVRLTSELKWIVDVIHSKSDPTMSMGLTRRVNSFVGDAKIQHSQSSPFKNTGCGLSIENKEDLISSFDFSPGFDQNNSYTRFDIKRNSYTLIDSILLSRSLSNIVKSCVEFAVSNKII